MRVFARARGGVVALIGLIVLMTGGIVGVALGELALTQPAIQASSSHRATDAPTTATLAAVNTPCGVGTAGTATGWGMPLPAQYLVNGSVDQGVDYSAPGGTPECAMGDGTIVGEGGPGLGGFGPNTPLLRVENGPLAGRYVYYGHAGPNLVHVNDHVTNGQQISIVGFGIVGLSTGPHIEVGFWNPISTNPLSGSPGGFGAGQPMLNYINGAGVSNNPNCTILGGHSVCGAIRDKYLALGGAFGPGNPVSDETIAPDGVGRFSHFSNDWSIYWTPATGAWSIHGAIRAKWASMGWERSVLGYPVIDEGTTPNNVGRYNYFSGHGAIYWTGPTGAWSIRGAVLDKWAGMGWETGPLGFPITDETGTPDGVGRFNHFSTDGSIYWTPGTLAHEIHGAVRAKWASMGWERSVLGYPVTDEGITPSKIGRFNYFSGHGAIYWTGPTGAWSIRGAVLDKWASMGWETGALGLPTTDEGITPSKIGRFNYFSGHGAIYWTGPTGAWSIRGAVLDKWASMGWETGVLGFPTTDETVTPDGVGRFNHFSTHGSIYWTPTTAAHEVHGAIRVKWAGMGWERSCLGYPASDEVGIAGGRQSNFQRGVITFDATSLKATSSCGS
jgi:uncharacterized protein with LGFP repeats